MLRQSVNNIIERECNVHFPVSWNQSGFLNTEVKPSAHVKNKGHKFMSTWFSNLTSASKINVNKNDDNPATSIMNALQKYA